MRAIILCLFLAACASPERRELRDGAPVRPAPVFVAPGYTPAGAGLPEYMPGPPEPVRVEPQPKPTRLLPPTREPGIWASNEPSAPNGPVVLGVPLPMPPINNVEPLGEQVEYAVRCAQSVGRRLDMLALKERALKLDMPPRTCLLAKLYALCLQRELEDEVKKASSGAGAAAVPKALNRTIDLAAEFRAKACDETSSPEVDDIASIVAARWGRLDTHGGPSK